MSNSTDDGEGLLQLADSPLVGDLSPSANHNCRKDVTAPDMVLMHYTGMPGDGWDAVRRLCSAEAQVSAHYVVLEDGRIIQLVAENRRAWHAGLGTWEGRGDINSRSIGIEIANPGHEWGYRGFPEAQIAAVIALTQDLCRRWPIMANHILAHSDIAPTRKEDPGELFPWDQLFQAGLGHWVPPCPVQAGPSYLSGDEGPPIQALQTMLGLYGYEMPVTGVFDAQTKAVVTAFQRHFRQGKVDGIADLSTLTTLRDLLRSLP